MKKLIAVLFCFLLLVGCGLTPQTSALNKVQTGITPETLVERFGEKPHGINHKDGYNILHYRMYGPNGTYAYYFTFDNNKLIKWEGFPIPRYQ